MPSSPPYSFQGAPFTGPFSFQALLADSIQKPLYEGLWVPTGFLKSASIEVFGTFTSLSMGIWGTNRQAPLNTYTVTVGGSITAADVATLTFRNPNLPGGIATAAYPVAGGNTTTTIATALAAAINANAALAALGVRATSVAAVLTITWPTVPPNMNTSFSSPGVASNIALAGSVSGSATETLTVTLGADGVAIATVTAVGLTTIAQVPAYMKIRLPTLTVADTAIISAALAGSG